jgi:serine/threonine protein kinase
LNETVDPAMAATLLDDWRAACTIAGVDPDGDPSLATLRVAPPISVEATQPSAPAFEIEEQLGAGGMGVVYRAKEGALNRRVALKKLRVESDEEARARFVGEAWVTALLDHPNIVPVYSLATGDDGSLSLAMKQIVGQDWSDLLKTDPPGAGSGSMGRHLTIFAKVLDAMAYAHERRIVHRDLKPQNVMVGTLGQVYVVDWGLTLDVSEGAREGESRGAPAASREVGSCAGTPSYLAPEMAAGELVTPASDVYLLGAILHELLLGKPPHHGATVINVIYAALKNDLFPLAAPGAPEELIAIATRCLQTDPAERFASALELRDAFLAFLSGDRARSEALRHEAVDRLNQVTTGYGDLFAAERLLQEALRAWPGNDAATQLMHDVEARIVHAALAANDLNLAESFLELVAPSERQRLAGEIEAKRSVADPVRAMRYDAIGRRTGTTNGILASCGLFLPFVLGVHVSGVRESIPAPGIAAAALLTLAAVVQFFSVRGGPLRQRSPQGYRRVFRATAASLALWTLAACCLLIPEAPLTRRLSASAFAIPICALAFANGVVLFGLFSVRWMFSDTPAPWRDPVQLPGYRGVVIAQLIFGTLGLFASLIVVNAAQSNPHLRDAPAGFWHLGLIVASSVVVLGVGGLIAPAIRVARLGATATLALVAFYIASNVVIEVTFPAQMHVYALIGIAAALGGFAVSAEAPPGPIQG